MRIIVVSDTHGNFNILKSVVKNHVCDADYFIHLGDGLREFDDLKSLYSQKKFLSVVGNCDFGFQGKLEDRLFALGICIFYTHGDTYGVKQNLDKLLYAGAKNNAHIVLYGHTHKNFTSFKNDMYVMNPGSLSLPRNCNASYGIIDITKAGIKTKIVEVASIWKKLN